MLDAAVDPHLCCWGLLLLPLVEGCSKCLNSFIADVRCTATPLRDTAARSADLPDLVDSGKNSPLPHAALLSRASYLVGHGVDGQSGGSPSRHDAVHPQRLRLQAVGGGCLQGKVRSGTTKVGGSSPPRRNVSENTEVSSLPRQVKKESEKETNVQSSGPMLDKRGGSRSSQVTAEAQIRSPLMEMC